MKSEKEIHVYFMPGMSANSLIFERIKLQHEFKSHFLEWIQPEKDESLNSYAKRLSLKIVHDNPSGIDSKWIESYEGSCES